MRYKNTASRYALIGITALFLGACSKGPKQNDSVAIPPTEAPVKVQKPVTFKHEVNLGALKAAAPVNASEGCIPLAGATTISAPGNYCLINNIIASPENPSGLTIDSDDVTVDLMGRTITTSETNTIRSGISATSKSNIVVKNGSVSGFLIGVNFRDVNNVSVEDMQLSGNQWRGVKANGDEIRVTDTVVMNMEGHINYEDSPPAAIDIAAPQCSISNVKYGKIRPINWNDNTGFMANGCALEGNVNSGLPENYCLPVRVSSTLSQPGSYCLQNDIAIERTNSDAMSISANDVSFDLGGYTISGPGGETLGSGVRAEKYNNIMISNGKVRGFAFGVRIENSNNSSVSDVYLDENKSNRLPQ